ncbi:MAG TPA: DUF4126 domain-containing protein [Acidobacteriota bacterium]|nr:DUF4126 domain-containing protein [Acidobacteriota bacterium]HNT16516.1 DUF4126 domain-containing protein [Acidobacteriota bacterium]
MEALKLLSTLFPMALAAGINIYATILIAGASLRLGLIDDPPEALRIFESWPILITAGVFYLLEFFADKIHFIDDIWDFIHTFVRPIGISVLVLASVSTLDPNVAVFAAIAAGGVSFVSHTAKAGTRMSMNVLSPFENFKNIAVSLLEDIFSAGLVFMAMKYPYFTAAVALAIFVFLLVMLPILFRWMKFIFTAVFLRLKSYAARVEIPDVPPGGQIRLLDHEKPSVSSKCKSQGVPSAGGRRGFLSVFPGKMVFTYRKWFRDRAWTLLKADIEGAYIRRRLLVDVLEVHYLNAKGKKKTARFVFYKDRSPLLEMIGAVLEIPSDKNGAGGAFSPAEASAG